VSLAQLAQCEAFMQRLLENEAQNQPLSSQGKRLDFDICAGIT
jgi:hypothetical protein